MTTRTRPTKKHQSAEAQSLAFITEQGEPIALRMPLAIKMLDGPHAEAARAALTKMLNAKAASSSQRSRIMRAFSRADRQKSKQPRRAKKPRARPTKRAAVAAGLTINAAREAELLAGPLTMEILAAVHPPRLYERWLELHKDDPDQRWERRLAEVPKDLWRRVHLHERDEMNALPLEQRPARLDLLLGRAMARP